jgi:hypothetical protein
MLFLVEQVIDVLKNQKLADQPLKIVSKKIKKKR